MHQWTKCLCAGQTHRVEPAAQARPSSHTAPSARPRPVPAGHPAGRALTGTSSAPDLQGHPCARCLKSSHVDHLPLDRRLQEAQRGTGELPAHLGTVSTGTTSGPQGTRTCGSKRKPACSSRATRLCPQGLPADGRSRRVAGSLSLWSLRRAFPSSQCPSRPSMTPGLGTTKRPPSSGRRPLGIHR